jgi:predicted alpha/beta superfamily hydrolase
MICNDDSPLPDTEVHYLRSEHVGDEFKVFVGRPHSSDAAPRGVLFMGDPWANFGTAVEITRMLCATGDLPPLLVVAVGYRLVTVEENDGPDGLRNRDFTPSADLTGVVSNQAVMGGAGRFLAFLRDELKPWVRERYGVDPDDSALFGYSLGGLFATYVLLNEPATFRRYGIGSPALFWDNELMFDREATYARTHDDLPAKVHFSVGANESSEGDRRWRAQLPADRRAKAEAQAEGEPPYDMVADAARMVAALRGRGYPSLEIEFEVWPGEYHQTAPPIALSRSLRYLFGAPR